MANFHIKNIKMTEGPVWSSVIRYAVPIALGSMLQILFNSADLAVVGNFSQHKTAAAAAVSATAPFISLIINMFMGLSVGVNVVLARSLGSGDRECSYRTVHSAMALALLTGAFVGAAGIALSPMAIGWMNCPDEAYSMSVQYMMIYFAGAPGMLVYNFGAAILRTKGDTQRPLHFLIIAGVLNVALNFLFVVVFGMNAAGVALATTVTQYLAAVLTVRCLVLQADETRLFLKKIRIYRQETLQIVRYGLPAGITSALYSISNIQIASQINMYGSAAINGSGAVGNLEGYLGAWNGAFNASVVAFAGQNIGAGKPERVKISFVACLIGAVTVSLAAGNLMWLFGEPLIKFFNASDPDVVTFGLIRAGVMLRTYIVYGFSNVLNGVLQAFGRSTEVMLNSVVSIFGIRTVWMTFVYPAHRTFDMLFWCYPASMLMIVAIDTVILAIVWAKYRKTGRVK